MVSDSPGSKSYEITSRIVLSVVGLPRLRFTRFIKAHIQVNASNLTWSTQKVGWKNGGEVHWKEKVALRSPLSSSAKITFSLLRDRAIFSKQRPQVSEGSLELILPAISEKSIASHEAVVLALKRDGKETCRLTIQITESSVTALSATEPLVAVSTQLSAPKKAIAFANDISATGSVVAGLAQWDLAGSLTGLVGNLSVVVDLGDAIAKIHPWASLAWNVLSIGLKLVKAQQERDNKIVALIQTIQSTYAIVIGSDIVKDERLQDVLGRILKQTVECGFFIQDYARGRSFAGKVVPEAFKSTDLRVAQYQSTFEQLQREFRGRIATKTALMTVGIASTVDAIRLDQLKDKLGRVEMDQSERDVCLPGTRVDAINMILDWYSDDSADRKNTMWLNGLAGAGKSTISTTIARMMDSANGLNLLGAFFFFDRNIAQRKPSTLIRTIAYQLAEFDPAIGARIQRVISDIPGIADMPLDIQFSKLLSNEVLGDVPWSRGPILVIIDALDESGTAAERERLLQVLSRGVSKLPPFMRLLIVSRPERDIADHFRDSNIRIYELQTDLQTSRKDITTIIQSRLRTTRERNKHYLHGTLYNWPSDGDVSALATLASGHFIWAHTACRIISIDDNPNGKLQELIRHRPTDTSDKSFKGLYQLYKTALEFAVQWSDDGSRARAGDLLGAVICAQVPLSCVAIDVLLGQHSSQTVSRFGSVLSWNAGPIRIIHASFYDYLTLHSTGEPWALSVDACNAQLACRCIALLSQNLRENMCNLVLPHPAEETPSEAISYAARFWIEHVCLVANPSVDFGDKIDKFLRKHLLHWIEALTIMKAYDVVMRSLTKLLEYIQNHFPGTELCDFVVDAHRFARYFASTISEHPLLVYISALPFTPHDTLVYKTFHNDKYPRVVSGLEPQWPPLLQMLYGHDGPVTSVSFSPDGSRIVSGSTDQTVRVWDAVTGRAALPPLEGHTGAVCSVAFSADGSRIVSGSADKTIRVWDALTGRALLPPLEGHEGTVWSVSFSPDGRRIVSGSQDSTVRVWDAATGQPALPPLEGHEQDVTCAAFSPDGSRIVSGSEDNTLRVWDALTGRAALPPLTGHEDWVLSAAFSPDGARIVSGSADCTVRVWHAASGAAALPPLAGHGKGVRSAAFSPDGARIVSGSDDQTVRMWHAATGQTARPPLEGHESAVWSVSFSPDGFKIVTASKDNIVRLWDVASGQAALPSLEGHRAMIWSVSFSPDGSRIVSGSYDRTVRVWDTITGQAALPPLARHRGSVQAVAFSPDGRRIVSGAEDSTVRVWDAATGQTVLPPLRGHQDIVQAVAFSADGCRIVSGSDDRTVRLWDAATGRLALAPLATSDAVRSVLFSLDGSRIIAKLSNGTVHVWDARTGILQEDARCDTRSPYNTDDGAGQVLASLDVDGYFKDINTGRHLCRLPAGFAFDRTYHRRNTGPRV
ncbi:hypothetical protein HWV62_18430 [Athelia sp. TMB]|nr:hypothetical protein HWV62_18430 [Athelia sp. TMB]